MPQEVLPSWVNIDSQWFSPSPIWLLEIKLIRVPEPEPRYAHHGRGSSDIDQGLVLLGEYAEHFSSSTANNFSSDICCCASFVIEQDDNFSRACMVTSSV